MITWNTALDVLVEAAERFGDVVVRDGERDAGHEGRDQAVAAGGVREAVGEQRQAERVDALVVVRDAAPGQALQRHGPAAKASDDADRAPTATSPISSSADCAASPPGAASTRKNSTSGSASPSLSPDSRLSVCRTTRGTRGAS